jgi:hypothetical protein
MTFVRFGVIGLTCALMMSCEPTPPKLTLVAVKGTVTLDGKPLETGTIVFTKDGEIPREVKIAAGKFDGQAVVGNNHIQFASYRAVGKAAASAGPGADDGTSMENLLPSRYNQESKEFRDVKSGDANDFKFELQSK